MARSGSGNDVMTLLSTINMSESRIIVRSTVLWFRLFATTGLCRRNNSRVRARGFDAVLLLFVFLFISNHPIYYQTWNISFRNAGDIEDPGTQAELHLSPPYSPVHALDFITRNIQPSLRSKFVEFLVYSRKTLSTEKV